jgi:hypothetical protein
MSGFLTNLLTRSFQPSAKMVQPRLNALFAPPVKAATWSAPYGAVREPEAVEEGARESEGAQGLNNDPPRPLAGAASPISADQMASPLAFDSTPSSLPLGISRSRVALERGEQGDSSAPTPTGTPNAKQGESSRLKSREPLQSTPTTSDDGSKPPPVVVAATSQTEKMDSSSRQSTLRRRNNRSGSVAPTDSSTPEISAPSVDRDPAVLEKPHNAHARAAVTLDRSHALDTTRLAEVGARDRDSTPSKTEARELVPAFPLPAAEKLEPAKYVESTNAELTSVRDPRSLYPALFRDRERRAPEPNQSAEPTIEVTIGRIEVRAPAPAQLPRVAAQPSRETSLDEYLRRRSGRGRE